MVFSPNLLGGDLLSVDGLLRQAVRVYEPTQGGDDLGTLGDLLTGNKDLAKPA
jgi:hypothetical protein